MPWKFPSGSYVQRASQTYLDNLTVLSGAIRVRFDTVVTGNRQYVFQHRTGQSGNQFSLQKTLSSDKFRLTVTSDVTNDLIAKESTAAIVAGTVYDVGFVWKKNDANGLKLFLDGVEDASGASTTAHTENYNTNGGTLWIGKDAAAQAGLCTIERFLLAPGVEYLAQHFLELRRGAWPHQLNLPGFSAFWPFFGSLVTAVKDWSADDRNITSGEITGAPLGEEPMGLLGDPSWGFGSTKLLASGGAPVPNPWIDDTPDVAEGTQSRIISGLTNGQVYQFKVRAIDDTGNISSDSLIVEATPTGVTSTPATTAPWRRGRRQTKWREGST